MESGPFSVIAAEAGMATCPRQRDPGHLHGSASVAHGRAGGVPQAGCTPCFRCTSRLVPPPLHGGGSRRRPLASSRWPVPLRRATHAAARSIIVLLALSSPVLAAANPAESLPERFEATFELRAKGATFARTRWSLAPGIDGRYVSTSRTEPAGMFSLIRDETRTERSEWTFAGDRLQPLAYRYERTGRKSRTIAITFDWEDNVARHESPDAAWKLPVPDGTMDKFSYVFALMRDLGRGERHLEYTIADGGRRLGRYVLTGIGEKRIETALGTFDAVGMRRKHERSPRETTFWCARALGYLPVKIVHIERDGTPVTLDIQSLDGIERREP